MIETPSEGSVKSQVHVYVKLLYTVTFCHSCSHPASQTDKYHQNLSYIPKAQEEGKCTHRFQVDGTPTDSPLCLNVKVRSGCNVLSFVLCPFH